MPFKTLLIILLLLIVTVSCSFGRNVIKDDNYLIHNPGLFNRLTDTGYYDNPAMLEGYSDTGNYDARPIEALPSAVSLDMPVPGDQGKQPSCGAWAAVYGAGSYYIHLNTGKPYSDSEILSPAFVFNQVPKGTGGTAAFIDNLNLFQAEGACSLKSMPYKANDYSTKPDSAQHHEAAKNKIKGWEKIDPHNLLLLKKELFQKKPVIFFIAIDGGFDKLTAPFTWKERRGRLGEIHSMLITGYDDSRNAFLVMNSWGTSWGDRGFVWIDYQFFLKNATPKAYILI